MYATEVGKGLPNNYIFGYFLNVSFDKKTQTTLLIKGSHNPIIDCPNISTLSNASVQVCKHGIRQSPLLTLKIA